MLNITLTIHLTCTVSSVETSITQKAKLMCCTNLYYKYHTDAFSCLHFVSIVTLLSVCTDVCLGFSLICTVAQSQFDKMQQDMGEVKGPLKFGKLQKPYLHFFSFADNLARGELVLS